MSCERVAVEARVSSALAAIKVHGVSASARLIAVEAQPEKARIAVSYRAIGAAAAFVSHIPDVDVGARSAGAFASTKAANATTSAGVAQASASATAASSSAAEHRAQASVSPRTATFLATARGVVVGSIPAAIRALVTVHAVVAECSAPIKSAIIDYAIATDGVFVVWGWGRLFDDDASATEAISVGAGKVLADSIVPGESLVVSIGFTRNFNDPDTATINGGLGWESYDRSGINSWQLNPHEQGDYVHATELAALSFWRSLSDSVTPSEVAALIVNFAREFSDSVTPSEGLVFGVGKGLSDSGTPSELLLLGVGKVLTDGTTANESASLVVSFARDFADSGALSESLWFGMGKVLADSAAANESASLVVSFVRDFADSETPSETLSIGFGKVASDTESPTEAIVLGVGKMLSEVESPTEATTLDVGKAISDSETPAETLTMDVGKALSDTETPAEAIVLGVGKVLSDTESPTDDAALSMGFARDFADLEAPSESLSLDVGKVLSDSESPGDALTAIAFGKAIDDSATASENIQLSIGITYYFNDADTATINGGWGKHSFDGSGLNSWQLNPDEYGDYAHATERVDSISFGMNPSDSSSAAESFDSSFGKSVADSISTSEAIVLDVGKPLSDSVSHSDEINSFSIGLVVTDSVTVLESFFNSMQVNNSILNDQFQLNQSYLNQ